MKKYLLLTALLTVLASAQNFYVQDAKQFQNALDNAALNDSTDTIILSAGTYKTTDVGGGPFTFTDNQNYDLTIKAADGLTADAVILDGDYTDTVLHFQNDEEDTKITLKNISIINGYERGIYSDEYLDLSNCNINNNGDPGLDRSGGGIFVESGLKMSRTTVSNNIAYKGGGIYIGDTHRHDDEYNSCIIEHSSIHHNSSKYSGGGLYINTYYYMNTVIKYTNIEQNIVSESYQGAGIYISGYSSYYAEYPPLIEKSRFSGNAFSDNYYSSQNGTAIYSAGEIILLNNLFVKNDKGVTVYLNSPSYVINNTFSDNNLGETTQSVFSGSGKIINNIFVHNNGGVYISGYDDSYLYNNYFDPKEYAKYDNATVFKKNNTGPLDGNVKFFSDYFLTAESRAVINKGLNPGSDEFRKIIDIEHYRYILKNMQTDYSGNKRIVNLTIDMGAREYDSSMPIPADKDEVAKLYVATYGRAPEEAGLDYWVGTFLPLKEIAKTFFNGQKEGQDLDKKSHGEFVDWIYQNAFGHKADAAGKKWWVDLLSQGKVTRDYMVYYVTIGATDKTNPDKTTLDNKTTVGLHYATVCKIKKVPLIYDVIINTDHNNAKMQAQISLIDTSCI